MSDEDELASEPDDADEIMLDKRQMILSRVGERLGEKTNEKSSCSSSR
jgi:hypothetical protein